MKDLTKVIFSSIGGVVAGVALTAAILSAPAPIQESVQSSQFSGNLPFHIYQIYDRDTGVYYAVTEEGGICPMVTMEGKTKLVDTGDGAVIHPNQGSSEE